LPVTVSLLANYQTLTNVDVTAVPGVVFQSSDPKVATISDAGVVRAGSLARKRDPFQHLRRQDGNVADRRHNAAQLHYTYTCSPI
jgi:hypothetical protein